MKSSPFYLPRLWFGSQHAAAFLPERIHPLSVHIKLTENCQARCISCDYWKTHWKNHIHTERAIELLNEIHDLGIASLRFTGGEPLLRNDFFEILEHSKASFFKKIVVQTNGLLLERFSDRINASPITHINISIDGMRDSNDKIRGIDGYFDKAMRGIDLMHDKKIGLSVTLNGISAKELRNLAALARERGLGLGYNILSKSLFFLNNADMSSMWPDKMSIVEIEGFVRDEMHRPGFEVEYISKYYAEVALDEPPCVLGYLQAFVLSNGDVLTGCYPLPAVGNILQSSFASILASDAYRKQSEAMVQRKCPGCTCGIESSLAMKHAVSSGFYELGQLLRKK